MKKLIFTFFTVMIATSLYAFDWSKYDLTVQGKAGDDTSVKYIVLKDSAGKTIYVEDKEISEEDALDILKMNTVFTKWGTIKVSETRYRILEAGISATVFPETFSYKGINIYENMPSGMNFSLTAGALIYNFRIKNESLFLKIDGVYIDEKALCDKLYEAITDPKSFLQRRDTESILSKIEALKSNIEVLDLKYKEETAKLSDEDKKIREDMGKNDAVVKSAMMSFQNDRFFGGQDPISKEKVEKVLAIKKLNPSAKADEIKDILSKEKFEISFSEIETILAVYFNDFTK